MSVLLEENPAYRAVTVMRIEGDDYYKEPLVEEHKVSGRATLIMLKGARRSGEFVGITAENR